MQVDLITNRGITNFYNHLLDDIRNCTTFNIASAFISKSGLELLKVFLHGNKNESRSGRLIISLYNCFNKKDILEELKTISIKGKGIKIRISKNKKFHWKYYHFKYSTKQTAYIGSANFTGEGLKAPGEFVSKFRFSQKDNSQSKRFVDAFENEWKDSFSIDEMPLENYKQFLAPISTEKLHPTIKKLFSHQKKKSEKAFDLKRIVRVKGNLTAKTEKIIFNNQPEWEQNDWGYFSCVSKAEFEACKSSPYILLVTRVGTEYEFNVVERMGDDIIQTEEGKYFIAYDNKSKSKQESPHIREGFKKIGFHYYSNNFNSKAIGKKQSVELCKLLQYKSLKQ